MKPTVLLALAATCLAWSPTDSYAPGQIECPSNKSLVRTADGLSSEEKTWLEGRHKVTDKNLIKFLDNAGLDDFNATEFITEKANRSINIGIAFSGGGYRAMLSGAGQLSALDNRTEKAFTHGLGGLLQLATYLAGLSGGNWLVGTIAMNNFTSVQEILDGGKIWDLENSIFDYGGYNLVKTYEYYSGIEDDLDDKRAAGFEVSLTDTWGRALSHQFFANLSDAGAALTWSTLQDSDVFTSHEMPMPISVADGRSPGTYIISGNSTVFEINPWEIGSWDPSLYQFMQVKYLGSDLEDGEPVNSSACVAGFDNAGFIMGTSSSLFNQFLLQINTTSLSSAIKSIITDLLEEVSHDEDDIAVYKPNPFYMSGDEDIIDSSITQNETLNLCDGGEDLQNIPLAPLLQPERELDVIFAYDNSADTDEYWPNGTSLVATYERQFLAQGNRTVFPYVPDQASFRNLNLTARPAFFGCDVKNMTSLLKKTNNSGDTEYLYNTPLIVYTANRPFSYWSNVSTYTMSYEEWEKRGMIENGFEVASRLNKTLDDDWAACVGCAIIRRTQERLGLDQSDQCQDCFDRYCWDGSIDDSDPGVNFTTNGTTDGNENDGNRTVSSAFSLHHGGFEVIKVLVAGLAASAIALCL